jgi:hypothetical protein
MVLIILDRNRRPENSFLLSLDGNSKLCNLRSATAKIYTTRVTARWK